MIDRHQPFGPTVGLRQRMDRLRAGAFVLPRPGDGQGWGGPALNVYDESDQRIVEARRPGLSPEDLDSHVEQGVLTISSQAAHEEERQERSYLMRQHRSGRVRHGLRRPCLRPHLSLGEHRWWELARG